MIVLQSKVTELEEELFKTKDQLRLVRSEWDHDKQDLQQVRREEGGERKKEKRQIKMIIYFMFQEVEAMNHVIQHLRKELEDTKFTKKRNSINVTDYKLAEAISLKKVITAHTLFIISFTCMVKKSIIYNNTRYE